MQWLRGVFIADPAVVLTTIFFGTISIFISFFDKAGRAQARAARVWARVLLKLSGIRVTVEGLEHIDPSGSYVFIANHASYMDTPAVLAHIPVQFRFLAKRGLFQIPFVGTHLTTAGHIPVPRGDPRGSVKTMQLAAETIQQRKISLLIFPEGGRCHDGVLRPFKEGGAYIAIRAGVPVVPVALIGTRAVLPYGGGIVRSGPVTVKIMKPIPTAGLNVKDRASVTEDVRKLILEEVSPENQQQPVLASTISSI